MRGQLPGGKKEKKHTDTTHMKHGQDPGAAVQEGEGGGEEGGGGGGGWGARVGMLGLSRRRWILRKKRESPPARGNPNSKFTLRKMTGSTGRTSYDLSQKLAALRNSRQKYANRGEVKKRGAATVHGIDPKTLRDWAPDPKTFHPPGDLHLSKNTYPWGKIQEEGGIFLFSRKAISPGINEKNHAYRPKRCVCGVNQRRLR